MRIKSTPSLTVTVFGDATMIYGPFAEWPVAEAFAAQYTCRTAIDEVYEPVFTKRETAKLTRDAERIRGQYINPSNLMALDTTKMTTKRGKK